jgi:hypothetical protein
MERASLLTTDKPEEEDLVWKSSLSTFVVLGMGAMVYRWNQSKFGSPTWEDRVL